MSLMLYIKSIATKKFCLPVVDQTTKRYKPFNETFGRPESWIEVLPKGSKLVEQNLPWRMRSPKARYTIQCAACLKPRVVFSDKRILRKELRCFLNGIENTEYMCGQDVFPEGFALVSRDHESYESQKVFFERFKTSHKLACSMPVQKTYYSLKDSKPICHKCISDLTDRADIIEMIEAQKELFSVVLPTCVSKECGKFTT